jgi:hypothetical protein
VPGKKWQLAAGVAAAGGCLLLAACSPVKTGAAAVVGSQRITSAALDTDVSNLKQEIPQYTPGRGTAGLPQSVLGQLINFAIMDRTARDLGITVSQSDISQAITTLYNVTQASAKANHGAGPASPQQLIVGSSVPLELTNQFGQYWAVFFDYLKTANGGTMPPLPTSSPAVQSAISHIDQAQCQAAKTLNIQVSPQFGQFGISQQQGYTVLAAGDTLSAAGGRAPVAAPPSRLPC